MWGKQLYRQPQISAIAEAFVQKKIIEPKYKVISIKKIDTPDGMVGDNWHQYIVGQGRSKIDGLKAGTLKEVTLHAETFAEYLNDRSKGKFSSQIARKQNATPPVPPKPENK